jgi:hypothetical protein
MPAEFLDRGKDCSDCGCPLVDAAAYGTTETTRAVDDWHGARELAAEIDRSNDTSGRTNAVTGFALITLSLALFVGSCYVTESAGSGAYFVAFGPFIYGCMRLARASEQKRTSKSRTDGPYR